MATWLDRVAARPAVQAAVEVGKHARTDFSNDREAQKLLFGLAAGD
jgi:hypothetical protein